MKSDLKKKKKGLISLLLKWCCYYEDCSLLRLHPQFKCMTFIYLLLFKLKSVCLDQILYLWCWPKWSQYSKQDYNSSSTHLAKIDTQMVTFSFLLNLIKHLCKSLTFFCFPSRHPTSFNLKMFLRRCYQGCSISSCYEVQK